MSFKKAFKRRYGHDVPSFCIMIYKENVILDTWAVSNQVNEMFCREKRILKSYSSDTMVVVLIIIDGFYQGPSIYWP